MINCASGGAESWLSFKAHTKLHTCATGYWYRSGKKHLLNFRCLLLEKKQQEITFMATQMWQISKEVKPPHVMVIQEDRKPSVLRDFCTEKCFVCTLT